MGPTVVNKHDLPKFVKPYVTLSLILGMIILLFVGMAMIWYSFSKTNQLLYYMLIEIGKAIVLTVLVSTVINWYFRHQISIVEEEKRIVDKQDQEDKEKYEQEKDERFRQTVNDQLGLIRNEVLMQTKEIANQAVSFDALQLADVDHFYPSRDEASKSIKTALLQSGVTSVKLIGISLNDFMRDENPDLHDAWVGLRNYIENDDLPIGSQGLDIRVLIIDPHSEGAYLRAKAEDIPNAASRLDADVTSTMQDLYQLEQKSYDGRNSSHKVNFAVRVYRTTPSMFLVWTPSTAFVQSYYFRPRRTRSRYPTIEFHRSGSENCVHKELGYHFDWTWDNASTPITNYLNMHCIGVADAIRAANIANMYYNYSESRARIINLIEQTEKHLWIKGISLHSYFNYVDSDLIEAVIKAYERNVDVKILLINPNGEQAKLRSFREYLISHSTSQLEQFDERARHGERLFTDTAASINFINLQLKNRIHRDDLGVKLYNSGPECFSLLTDDAVLVEQYDYGKIEAQGRPGLILGGDVPVTEYRRIIQTDNIKKDPYKLFYDSFEYVYKYCSIDLEKCEDLLL